MTKSPQLKPEINGKLIPRSNTQIQRFLLAGRFSEIFSLHVSLPDDL